MGKKEISFSGGGIFTTLLQITFIVLKLCGIINWSWLWVLAPIWLPFVILIALGLLGFLIIFVVNVVKGALKK